MSLCIDNVRRKEGFTSFHAVYLWFILALGIRRAYQTGTAAQRDRAVILHNGTDRAIPHVLLVFIDGFRRWRRCREVPDCR